MRHAWYVKHLCLSVFICGSVFAARTARAGQADVVDVKVLREAGGTYHFDVTVRHADTGWEHYADRWEILAPDGSVLVTRPLRHPHIDEQPVTRDLAGVKIPDDIRHVTVRAHDSQHGYGGREVGVDLPR
jgi:hypothetical protein